MKNTRRLVLPVLAVAVLGVGAPAFAADGGGGTSTITATLTPLGSRSVTAVAPVALTNTTDPAVATGLLAVTVTEVARSGTNAWSLTATASALTDVASHTIAASNLSVLSRSVTHPLGGGTATAATGTSSLGSAATLFSTTGEDPTALYTAEYIAGGTVSLAIPSGTPAGAYTGTLTVSLI